MQRCKKYLCKGKVCTNYSTMHREKRWYHKVHSLNNKRGEEHESIENVIEFTCNNFFSNLENDLELVQFIEDL